MQAWTIAAEVPDDKLTETDGLVNELEFILRSAIQFAPDGTPTFPEWMNGILAGVAELNNIVICPEEYPNPRLSLKMASLQLSAILLRFLQAQSYSLQQLELEVSPDTTSEQSSSTMDESNIS